MVTISASLVKELRDKTNAGIMDCKKALVESEGDMDKAVEILRKAGIIKAEKKSARSVKEGKIVAKIANNGKVGCMIELMCETDFVAKNPKFGELAEKVMDKLYSIDGSGDMTELLTEAVKDDITALIATVGENMQLSRAVKWISEEKLGSYIHMQGKIGVLVDIAGDITDEVITDICMQIAAFSPRYIIPDEIPESELAKEKEIMAAQIKGKPENIVEKIVSGKINKWYSEVCLMKQPWIRDDKTCLEKLYPNLKVNRFLRWEIGEE